MYLQQQERLPHALPHGLLPCYMVGVMGGGCWPHSYDIHTCTTRTFTLQRGWASSSPPRDTHIHTYTHLHGTPGRNGGWPGAAGAPPPGGCPGSSAASAARARCQCESVLMYVYMYTCVYVCVRLCVHVCMCAGEREKRERAREPNTHTPVGGRCCGGGAASACRVAPPPLPPPLLPSCHCPRCPAPVGVKNEKVCVYV